MSSVSSNNDSPDGSLIRSDSNNDSPGGGLIRSDSNKDSPGGSLIRSDSNNDSPGGSLIRSSRSDQDEWVCPLCGNVNLPHRQVCNVPSCHQPRYPDYYADSIRNGLSVGSMRFLSPAMHMNPILIGETMGYLLPIAGESMSYPLNVSPIFYQSSMPQPMGYGFRPPFRDSVITRYQNDWICPDCGNINYSFRIVCNMRRCSCPRPTIQEVPIRRSQSRIPKGSWICQICRNINFPFRIACNGKYCGADKSSDEPPEFNEEPSESCVPNHPPPSSPPSSSSSAFD